MRGKKSLFRRLLPAVVLTAGLLLISTACAGEITTQDIQGILQAMEGQEMVIRLDDGELSPVKDRLSYIMRK